MAYTDDSLNSNIKVKKVHVSELVDKVNSLINTAKLTSSVSVGTMDYSKVKKVNIANLQKAVNNLESSFSNNCCESNHCQTCQSSRCQSCQNACTCQSSRCQTCQSSRCQSCQKECYDPDCSTDSDTDGE